MGYFEKWGTAAMVLLVAGCATTADYEKMLNQWVGVRADVLRSTWGQPSSEHRSDYGGTVLEYVRGEAAANPPAGGPVTTSESGTRLVNNADGVSSETYATTSTTYVFQGASNACTTDFYINLAGVITSWTWAGSGCKS